MNYLITFTDNRKPFFTKWFMPENNFCEGMIVYDLMDGTFTTDGKTWHEVSIDHL